MNLCRIDNLDDPRISAYRDLPERDVARRHALFIAEGRYILRTLLAPRSLYEPDSLLLTPTALDALSDTLQSLDDHTPVYVVEQPLMNRIVGFNIHRGCLAAGRRRQWPPAESLIAALDPSRPSLLVVLEALNNHDNIGGILRNAAAFGADALLLDPACADPLYRKAIRVSMGGALVLPHARFAQWPAGLTALEDAGYTTIALTPTPDAPEIGDLDDTLRQSRRVALLLGAEGPGLTEHAMHAADLRLRVPMRTDLVDSLNVAATSAIALHLLTRGPRP